MLEIKGKAVELLEAMLEQTSPDQSATIKKSLQGSVNEKALKQSMKYFKTMAMEPQVKKEDKDDDAERGKFQCYHVLIALADYDKKSVGMTSHTHTHTHPHTHTRTHTHTQVTHSCKSCCVQYKVKLDSLNPTYSTCDRAVTHC